MHAETTRASALSVEDLLKAYTLGYFPMSEARNDPDIFWVLPEYRGALPLEHFHIPRKLRKTVRDTTYQVTIDRCFRRVMEECATSAKGREDTWINDKIIATYCQLAEQGFAHSVEVWDGEDLVGGLYGVSLGGAFFGESMFSRVTDASKIALVHLVARMKIGGYKLLDTQFYTPHLGQFGVMEIPKSDYQKFLDDALSYIGDFEAMGYSVDGSTILQSITQTS